MNSCNWRDLKFPVKILKDNYVLPAPINTGADIFKLMPSDYLSDEFFDLVHDSNLYPIQTGFLLFRYSTGYSCPVHVDDTISTCNYSINFTLEETASRMEWFRPQNGAIPITGITKEHTAYRQYDIDDLILIDSKNVYNPTLVRVNIPHRGINFDNKDRWCFSVRFFPKHTFEEAEEIFKKYLT